MKRAKYVVILVGAGMESIIIFPEFVQHREFIEMRPIRAGFINIHDEFNPKPACFGQSDSLNLKSDPEKDSVLAERLLIER